MGGRRRRRCHEELDGRDRLTRLYAKDIRSRVAEQWADLLALEAVARELTDAFRDDAVIPNHTRSTLERAQALLESLHHMAQPFLGEIETLELDESRVRRYVDQIA